MGSTISGGIIDDGLTVSDELRAAILYMCGVSDIKISVDDNISLYVAKSKLSTTFVDGKDKGLFTHNPIPKSTAILDASRTELCTMMNDGAINLDQILKADTSVKMYQAWNDAMKTYYDITKIKQVVNVRMVSDVNSSLYYEAIQDIPANGELIRVYGFTTWTLELFDILTNKNIVGFARFIDDLSKDGVNDPYTQKIKVLHETLKSFEPHICALNEYDESMKDQATIKAGSAIKQQYILQSFLTGCI